MRLIDADMLDDVVQRINENGGSITRTGYKTVDRILFEFPAIEAEPIRHGHWELSPFDGNWACSICGNKPYHSNMKNMNYCPNCGAKMDKDEGQEPEINSCRGCDDYDGQGGCKSNGGCGAKMDGVEG